MNRSIDFLNRYTLPNFVNSTKMHPVNLQVNHIIIAQSKGREQIRVTRKQTIVPIGFFMLIKTNNTIRYQKKVGQSKILLLHTDLQKHYNLSLNSRTMSKKLHLTIPSFGCQGQFKLWCVPVQMLDIDPCLTPSFQGIGVTFAFSQVISST